MSEPKEVTETRIIRGRDRADILLQFEKDFAPKGYVILNEGPRHADPAPEEAYYALVGIPKPPQS